MSIPSLNPPQLIIRADADAKIGGGHVMRCLALAQGWQRLGGEAVFVGRLEGEGFNLRLSAAGFKIQALTRSHPHPDDMRESLDLLARLPGTGPTWVVVDGYHFDPEYQAALRGAGFNLLVIDDMAHLPEYHADIILNPNIGADGLHYRCRPGTVCLLDTRYAILRQEFLCFDRPRREVPEKAGRILVTLGAADPDNVTGAVIRALKHTGRKDLAVKIVVGPVNPHLASLQAELRDAPFFAELLRSVADMPALMAWADMAISAGGGTCWELAFMGVPFMVTVLAENQERLASGLADAGAAIACGRARDLSTEELARLLLALIDDRAKRVRFVKNGQGLVDGKGVRRVIERLWPTDFTLRPVAAGDSELLFDWANDPQVRAVSFHAAPISRQEHNQWFTERLHDRDCVMYIAHTAAGKPLGQVRFAVQDGRAIISLSIAREFRGLGLGERLIRQACERLADERKVSPVQALVKDSNIASARAFLGAGFREVGKTRLNDPSTILLEYGKEFSP